MSGESCQKVEILEIVHIHLVLYETFITNVIWLHSDVASSILLKVLFIY